ncbi:MAG: L-2-amino-thiazoline-4-carboxylic acid hydrolase [Anaerolineae bacterium]|nr:L-2-amino-thiazoline-4-carboxylic acid hydrolase [Anaerolineae bacterium]
MNEQDDTLLQSHIRWLSDWFAPDKRDVLCFTDQEQRALFDELATLDWRRSGIIAQLDALQERLGPIVVDVIEAVVAQSSRRVWTEVAQQETSKTIDDLIRVLWEPGRGRLFDYTVEIRDDGVQMRCTRCFYADLGKPIGGTKWFYHLLCMGDPDIVEGFNPKMGFRRTKTLMEGHDCCDHFYFMKE